MVKRMVGLTFSSSNVHGVVDNNSNTYINIVMDAMRMNQGFVDQCPIIDEELHANVARFFNLLKDSNEYEMGLQIKVNYQSLHMCSPLSQMMG
jgi:hypothetical protein